jgi:hypothetical protein
MDERFEWPCDRRDAHHPHPEDGCPGVGAHPATQIGGGWSREQWDY